MGQRYAVEPVSNPACQRPLMKLFALVWIGLIVAAVLLLASLNRLI
jgi:hypothetical protein